MDAKVASILREAEEKNEKFKTTEVLKDLDLEIDVGNLLAVDQNPLNDVKLRKNKEDYVKELTRDNTQLLINQIWELPSERNEDVVIVKLPEPTTRVPRAKPVPKVKPLTKWQEFAKTKGIQKRKKDNLVWDENTKTWNPRYGYRRAPEPGENWVMEYKQNQDPYEDLFAKKKEEKCEKVAKNELQRLRNIARARKQKVPGVGLTPTETQTSGSLSKAAVVAKSSTASLGRFTQKLPNEKPQKKAGIKRKFEPVLGDSLAEKRRNLDILDKVKAKQPLVNAEKAANSFTHGEELQQAEENILGNKKKKSKNMKGGKKGMKNGGRKGKKGVGFGKAKKGPNKGKR